MSKRETTMDTFHRMHIDRAQLQQQQKELRDNIQALTNFQRTLRQLKSLQHQPLHTEMDLGCGMSISAVVKKPDHLFVDVGLGIKVWCSLEEAIEVVELRRQILQTKLKNMMVRVGKTRALIDCTTDILRLLELTDKPHEEQHTDEHSFT